MSSAMMIVERITYGEKDARADAWAGYYESRIVHKAQFTLWTSFLRVHFSENLRLIPLLCSLDIICCFTKLFSEKSKTNSSWNKQ